MILNIGANKLIYKKDIVGIFDLDTATRGKETKDFLKNAEKQNKTEMCGNDLPKAFVVTKDKVYLTTLSSASLAGRTKKADI